MRAIELSQNSGLASRKQPHWKQLYLNNTGLAFAFALVLQWHATCMSQRKSLVASLTTDEVIPDDAECQNYGADKAISCIKTIIGSTVQCSFIVACESLHSVKDLLAR